LTWSIEMNARERFLAMTLGGMLAVGGVLFLGYQFIYAPLAELNRRTTSAEKRTADARKLLKDEQDRLDRTLRLSPRLGQWEKLSLPANPDGKMSDEEYIRHLQVSYERQLSYQLAKGGMRNVVVTAGEPEPKTPPPQPGKPPVTPPLRKLVFTAVGATTLDGLIKSVEDFHRTSLLQQVRGCVIKMKPPTARGARPGEMDVALTVEVFMAAGAEKRTDLLPSNLATPPVVLAPGRTYHDILGHNPFTGSLLSPKQGMEKPEDVLPFVRLTSVEQRGFKWFATLSDLAKSADLPDKKTKSFLDTKFWIGGLTDNVTFAILDRFDNVMCKGTVLDIQKRTVYFYSEGRIYRIRTGESMAEAMKEPLPYVNMIAGGLGTAGLPKDAD
jgi:hypothetical protein